MLMYSRQPFALDKLVKTALEFRRALSLVWEAAPRWMLVNSFLVLVQGLLPLASLYLMKLIVDGVTVSLEASDKTAVFQSTTVWILLAAGLALLSALMRSFSEYASEAQSLQVTDAVADILHAKSVAVDLEYYEDPGYYDTLHRAQREAPFRPTRIVNGLIQVTQNSISLLVIVGMLISFNWLLALILLLTTLPGALLRLLHSRRLYAFEKEQTEKELRAWSYHFALTKVSYAKEMRLLNLGQLFQTRYRQLREQIRSGKLSLSLRRVRADLFAQALTTAALFGSLAWMAWQTILGEVTLGDMMIYYIGFQSGLNYFLSVLRGMAGLYEDNLFLTSLYQFLDLKPKIVSPHQPLPVPLPISRGITFQNVEFTYPSREKETLQDINLTLASGEVIALVGKNGSGKSTLIKLLCRLYDPSHGTIMVDGVDLRSLDPVKWRQQIGVTFQDYVHYALTVKENIWLGNVEAHPDPQQIAQAARRSGADGFIRSLPQAYDTILGHSFKNGQELSGGEWQKIALARTFWREAQILVLDEPTSSLDPLAEAELFREFRGLLDGRSAILISHRFSTVKMADCIYVLDQGRIVERGTHSDLIAQKGCYANLYNAQAQHYNEQ